MPSDDRRDGIRVSQRYPLMRLHGDAGRESRVAVQLAVATRGLVEISTSDRPA